MIAVFGDYDVDGVCSTAMMLRTLRALGADPVWELPNRFDEGYGLSGPAVERLADVGWSYWLRSTAASRLLSRWLRPERRVSTW